MFLLDNIDDFPKLNQINDIKEFISDEYPLVLSDKTINWEAFSKWKMDFLKKEFGNHTMSSSRVENGVTKYVVTNISDYIDYALSCTDDNPFYGITNLHLKTNMKNDYDVPACFKCIYANWHDYNKITRKIDLSSLYIGPAKAKSNLHIDIWGTSFWNALFEGTKLWVFFNKEENDMIYNGKVDPFNPNLLKYPNYRFSNPLLHVQKPGEIIYSPGNFYHAVYLIQPSIALSENFISIKDADNVLSHFEKLGFKNAYAKMLEIIDFETNKKI